MTKRRSNGKAREARTESWIAQELAGCEFQMSGSQNDSRSCFGSCQAASAKAFHGLVRTGANTKAAYRFFANERVSEAAILGGHFQATEKRLASGEWPILILHDTTELSFHRKDVAAVGMTTRMPAGKLNGKPQHYNVCGILMHSSLAVTAEGLFHWDWRP